MPKKIAARRRRVAPPEIVTVGTKASYILGQKAQIVGPEDWHNLVPLVAKMMRVLGRIGGQGLSAPQVGLPWAVSIIRPQKTRSRPQVKSQEALVMINPKILSHSKKMAGGSEGCLSVQDTASQCIFRARVLRYRMVTVEFQDIMGEVQRRRFCGFPARIVQHEIDHLAGILFLMRVDWRDLASAGLHFVPL